jgi:hypothetical protein
MRSKIFLLFVSLLCSIFSFSQSRFLSLGAEFALPTADFSDAFRLGFGGTLGYTHGLSERFSAVGRTGILFFQTDPVSEDLNSFYFQLPILIGARYHPVQSREGLQLGILAGIQYQDVYLANSEPLDEKDAFFSFAPEVGWFFTPRISASLRFQMTFIPERYETYSVTVPDPSGIPELQQRTEVREEDILSYLALRLAYNL